MVALFGLALGVVAVAGTIQRSRTTSCVLFLNGSVAARVRSFDLIEARTAEKLIEGGGRPSGSEIDLVIESPSGALTGWIHSNLVGAPTKRNASLAFYGPDNLEVSRIELPEAILNGVVFPELRPYSDKVALFSIALRGETLTRVTGSRRALDTSAPQALDTLQVKGGAFRFNIRQVDIEVGNISAWRAVRRPGPISAPLAPLPLDLSVSVPQTQKYFQDWTPNDFRNGAILMRNAAGKSVFQFSFEVNVLSLSQPFDSTAVAPAPLRIRLNLQKPSFSTSAP